MRAREISLKEEPNRPEERNGEQKFLRRSGMKFGARKAEPTHEPVIEEAPTKKYEILPRKLPWESGMKFGTSKGGAKFSRGTKFGGRPNSSA
ncbi:hypothetical protein COCNU_02G008060 [Cocos nucifera]|uniref:Uncharacterized protein n=1 Tax=Cocos nucifera TaxID=13894 RepID=A0A8K0HZS3_COCNU|nr:hypothetical protein COCNU_02G008060 [Cocos nucifera]